MQATTIIIAITAFTAIADTLIVTTPVSPSQARTSVDAICVNTTDTHVTHHAYECWQTSYEV
eukprot:6169417-Lingulodinium_polyedra.AAC.1